jgi:hypothetical protein
VLARDVGLIEMTLPDKPRSSKQQVRSWRIPEVVA